MTRPLLPPELEREVERLKIRVSDLERILQRLVRIWRPEVVYCIDEELVGHGESEPFYLRQSAKLVEVLLALRVAGVDETVVDIRKNGDSLGTVTIPAGYQGPTTRPFGVTFGGDVDYLSFEVISPSPAARGLTAQARFDFD